MNDLAKRNACHRIEPSEWEEILSSYERGPITVPEAPYVDLEFVIDFPFSVSGGDTLLLSAYSPSRGIDHRIFDAAPPRDGRVTARLAVDGDQAIEEYWFSVDLIRPSSFMTCNWSMEERFELPYPNYPVRWSLVLLPEGIPTDDGGTRMTRISPAF